MKPYHNEGFGKAFFVVFLLLIPLPILGLWLVDGKDWSDRFAKKIFFALAIGMLGNSQARESMQVR